MKLQIILITLISVFIPTANAASNKQANYQAMYDKCLKDAGSVNNTSVISCSEFTSNAVKKEINILHKKIYTMISGRNKEDTQQFETSQKAWLNYRNTHCKLSGLYVGSPMYSFCPMKLNIARVKELRELAGDALDK